MVVGIINIHLCKTSLASSISPSTVYRYSYAFTKTYIKFFSTAQFRPIVIMKRLYVGIVFLMYNYMIRGQDFIFPTDEEISHVSGGNSTKITDRIPVSIPDGCPKNMLFYPGSGTKDSWVCDCRPRFLYFPLDDSCHEAYRQGPCPSENYVVLPKNEVLPRCVKNPCLEDGVVLYNGTCYPLRTIGGPCSPKGVLGVNEITFQLECVSVDTAPFIIITTIPKRTCPPGSRRNMLGICRNV